jgi:hypothetical protein
MRVVEDTRDQPSKGEDDPLSSVRQHRVPTFGGRFERRSVLFEDRYELFFEPAQTRFDEFHGWPRPDEFDLFVGDQRSSLQDTQPREPEYFDDWHTGWRSLLLLVWIVLDLPTDEIGPYPRHHVHEIGATSSNPDAGLRVCTRVRETHKLVSVERNGLREAVLRAPSARPPRPISDISFDCDSKSCRPCFVRPHTRRETLIQQIKPFLHRRGKVLRRTEAARVVGRTVFSEVPCGFQGPAVFY